MKKYLIILLIPMLFFVSCGKDKNPINSYYKNLPMIQGMTMDEKPKVYNVKIELGYENGNKKVQTELNKRKEQITDIIRSLLSSLPEEQFLIDNQPALKELIKEKVNEVMIEGDILEIYLMQLQVFEYN